LPFVGWVMYEYFENQNKEIMSVVKQRQILRDAMELVSKDLKIEVKEVEPAKEKEGEMKKNGEIYRLPKLTANRKYSIDEIGPMEVGIKEYTEIEGTLRKG